VVDGSFDGAGGFLPFDWALTQDENLWAAREADPTRRGSVLRLVALNGYTGEVARQLLRLAPGRYRLSARFGDVPAERDAGPKAEVRCASKAGEGPTLAMLAPPPGGSGVRAAQMVVPAECRFQWLILSAAAASKADTESPWVDDISVAAATG
jgi:hypothetical protein